MKNTFLSSLKKYACYSSTRGNQVEIAVRLTLVAWKTYTLSYLCFLYGDCAYEYPLQDLKFLIFIW